MNRAEAVVVEVPHPFTNRAISLFSEARDKIFELQEPTRQALDEANRQLLAEMREAGLVE